MEFGPLPRKREMKALLRAWCQKAIPHAVFCSSVRAAKLVLAMRPISPPRPRSSRLARLVEMDSSSASPRVVGAAERCALVEGATLLPVYRAGRRHGASLAPPNFLVKGGSKLSRRWTLGESRLSPFAFTHPSADLQGAAPTERRNNFYVKDYMARLVVHILGITFYAVIMAIGAGYEVNNT